MTGTKIVVGIAWFQKEDWGRLKQLCPDRDEMYETYNIWLAEAKAVERKLKKLGHKIVRVPVISDELAGWCALRARVPNQDARAEYVNEKVRSD
jgi:hypothetical protein